jgi:hydrogenase/urease accessory protein HupE
LQLGGEHLVTGLDHLLFVIGLLLLVRGLRARLLSLTAFTLGHSLTLGLSALAIVQLPQRPVEIGIALSLLVLALELVALQRPHAQQPRRPWLMAVSFGLLHGLGFASALAETGLPARAIILALFSFNLGVELAQLLVVLAALPLASLFVRALPTFVVRARLVLAYALGAIALVWCVERALYAL